jgi:hypothetical protein
MARFSMTSLDAAMQLNNEAITLLVSGQEKKALQQLQQAVSIVKRNVARFVAVRRGEAARDGGTTSSTSSSSAKAQHEVAQKEQPSSAATPSSCCEEQLLEQQFQGRHQKQQQQQQQQHRFYDSVELAGLSDRQCYVYNRAFRVTVDQLPTSSIEEAARVASAVVIFNMGLVLHRVNLLRNRAVPAQKALALYRIILDLFHGRLDGIGGAIQLATLNNIAQLQFEEGQYEAASRGFTSLANIVRAVAHSPLGPNEMRGVVINILCLRSGARLAPAA